MDSPACVLVFSGKRKSGKDYLTDILQQRIGPSKCDILRLSAPLKQAYAKEHNLDFGKLLDASEYKEKFRPDMIRWGEEKRNADPGYFCRLTTRDSVKPVWIISDARRLSDVQYFQENHADALITIRVTADEKVRVQRGWKFTEGVDDVESECGLDPRVDWDVIVENNGDASVTDSSIEKILSKVQLYLTKAGAS